MLVQDKAAWMKLCEKVSSRCLVVGDAVYHRPGLLKDEPISEEFKTSGIVLRVEPLTTVTHLSQVAKKMQGLN